MEQVTTDDAGAPKIKSVNAKIGALERRAGFLQRQVDEGRGSATSLDFARAELSALRAAIAALRWHLSDVEGLDQPILALQELVDAVGDEAAWADSPELKRARKVLEEWGG